MGVGQQLRAEWEIVENFLKAYESGRVSDYGTLETTNAVATLYPQRHRLLRMVRRVLASVAQTMRIFESARKYNGVDVGGANGTGGSERVEEAVDTLRSILAEHSLDAASTRQLSAVLLPVNRKTHYKDVPIDTIGKMYRDILYRAIHRNRGGIGNCLGIVLLSGGVYTNGEYLDVIREFFVYLSELRIDRVFQKRIRRFVSMKNCDLLRERRGDFRAVHSYFRDSPSIYSSDFRTWVKRDTLIKLYSDFDHEKLISVINNYSSGPVYRNTLRCIYRNYKDAGLLAELREAYSSLIHVTVDENITETLYQIDRVDRTVRRYFKGPDFAVMFRTFCSSLLLREDASEAVVSWVDRFMLLNKSPSEKPKNMKLLRFAAHIIVNAEYRDHLSKGLRIALANRILFHYSRPDGKYIVPATERLFLGMMDRKINEKMIGMLNDVEKTDTTGPYRMLLMTRCKWPALQSVDIEDHGIAEIQAAKARTEKELAEEEKRIQWLDSITRTTIALFNKTVTVTLFQYTVIRKILEWRGSRKLHYAAPKTAIAVDPFYQKQMDILISRQLIYDYGSEYALNKDFDATQTFLQEFYIFEPGTPSGKTEPRRIYDGSVILEAKISRIMKEKKRLPRNSMLDMLDGHSGIDKALDALIRKGIIEMDGENIAFLP